MTLPKHQSMLKYMSDRKRPSYLSQTGIGLFFGIIIAIVVTTFLLAVLGFFGGS